MTSRHQMTTSSSTTEWRGPVHLENYDRSPLTKKERRALERCTIKGGKPGPVRGTRTARKLLARFDRAIADVYYLRHRCQSKANAAMLTKVRLIMHREMHRHGKMFWDWCPDEWLAT